MIYLVYLLLDDGSMVWEYTHPALPRELKESVDRVGHDSIISMLSAFSMFGKEIFQNNIRSIRYDDYQIFFEKLSISKDKSLLAIVITDINEKRQKILKVLNRFLRINNALLLRSSGNAVRDASYENISKILQDSFSTMYYHASIGSFRSIARRYGKLILYSLVLLALAIVSISISYLNYNITLLTLSLSVILLVPVLNIVLKRTLGKKRKKYYRLVT